MRPKKSNRRALRILAAARDEFAAEGFAGARIDRIAHRAGVNKQLLFYYYHSKRGLYDAAIIACSEELDRALGGFAQTSATRSPALSRLEQMLARQYAFFESNRPLVELLAQGTAGEARSFQPAVKRLVILLAEGQGLGEIRDDIDPHLTAGQALVLMLAYLRMESLIAVSAEPLGIDGPSLSSRWREAALKLVVEGVRTR